LRFSPLIPLSPFCDHPLCGKLTALNVLLPPAQRGKLSATLAENPGKPSLRLPSAQTALDVPRNSFCSVLTNLLGKKVTVISMQDITRYIIFRYLHGNTTYLFYIFLNK